MAKNGETMVKIKLPYIPGGDKMQYVNVNDRNMFVPRGEVVEVPECFAEVLEGAEKMTIEAYEKRARLQKNADF